MTFKVAVFALFALPALVLAVSQASATEPDAKQIFKAMSDYLGSQKTISATSMGAAPQYTLTIRDWKTDGETSAAEFTFTPPEGGEKLGKDALAELNDVPPPAEPAQ